MKDIIDRPKAFLFVRLSVDEHKKDPTLYTTRIRDMNIYCRRHGYYIVQGEYVVLKQEDIETKFLPYMIESRLGQKTPNHIVQFEEHVTLIITNWHELVPRERQQYFIEEFRKINMSIKTVLYDEERDIFWEDLEPYL